MDFVKNADQQFPDNARHAIPPMWEQRSDTHLSVVRGKAAAMIGARGADMEVRASIQYRNITAGVSEIHIVMDAPNLRVISRKEVL